jgi:hypothetical protein
MPQTSEIVAKHLRAQVELPAVRLESACAKVDAERVRDYCSQAQQAITTVDGYLDRVDESDRREIRDKLARLKRRLAEVGVTPESA